MSKIIEIDIKGGEMTFGQRIDLGKLFSENITELQMFEKTFKILHNTTPSIIQYRRLLPYFKRILEGLKFWSEQEASLLKYEPTIEEKQAGVVEFAKKVGEFATIKSLAKAYSCDPDDILKWKYGKVFGILYTDLEEHKFNQKYQKVIESKYKTK